MKKLIAEIMFGEDNVVFDNLLSANFGSLDRGDLTELSEYGIYANNGSFSFIDINSKFKSLYDQYKKTDVTGQVRFWFIYKKKCLATFDIENANIDEETKKVDIDLISNLITWQNKKIYRSLFRQYDMLFVARTLYDLVDFAKNNFAFEITVKTTRLYNTIIDCPDIDESPTLWDFMTQICQAGMCMISDDEYGVPCIYDTLPVRTGIIVPPNKILGVQKHKTSSIPNASIQVVERAKYEAKTDDRDTKNVALYDADGKVISYDQGLISFSEYEESYGYRRVVFKYRVEFSNPTFDIDSVVVRGTKQLMDNSGYYHTIENVEINEEKILFYPSLFGNYCTLEVDIMPSKSADSVESPNPVWTFIRDVRIFLRTKHYTDLTTEEKSYKTSETAKNKVLSTNSLIQTNSTYNEESLADNILEITKSRYEKPIRFLEIECLFGQYMDDEGNVALYENDFFKKYQTIIPYVVRNGKIQPYSIGENGYASSFEIVGIEYSYNGVLRQKLYLQEVLKFFD